jgi:hypothetical protein
VRRLLIPLLAALTLGGCGRAADGPIVATPPRSPLASIEVWTYPSPSAAPSPASSPGPALGGAWEVTVYYTAVEKYHHGKATGVTGCPKLDCQNGHADLGRYPKDFVRAVKDEGTGRTSAGKYLNWSYDTGFWLDSSTRDSYGNPLEPFVSAAADPDVLARGTRFTIAGCGKADDGSTPSATVCAALRSAHWQVTDEFTPGLGGKKHLDAYIGPETGPGFTDSDWYITLEKATLE